MWVELLYAIPLGLMLSFAAGPIFFVIIETSISTGKLPAFTLDLGAVTADLVFIALAFYGSQPFLAYLKSHNWLVIMSGMAVAGFGVYYILKSRKTGQLKQNLLIYKKRFLFFKGFLLNFLNIGVLFFWITTTVAVGSLLNHDAQKMWSFYGATLASYLALDILKIYFANRFKKYLAGRRMQLIEKLLGLGLVAFGIFIALKPWI